MCSQRAGVCAEQNHKPTVVQCEVHGGFEVDGEEVPAAAPEPSRVLRRLLARRKYSDECKSSRGDEETVLMCAVSWGGRGR